jgi:precorrin-6A/cobalt-precorrin-6A reductase
MRILILGGTTEATVLAHRLGSDARFAVTVSLAGRTETPRLIADVAVRSGGFGGAAGLAQWLADSGIEAVVDATHPFAAQISANAAAVTGELGLPLCTIVRPQWSAEPGDLWHTVPNMGQAADALGAASRRVFLSVGRQSVGAFQSAPQHAYVIRSIEPPARESLPPDTMLIQARGPFTRDDEIDLLRQHRIDVVVTKNAGGHATYAKLEAARELAIPVVMIERPAKAGRHIVSTAEDALTWLGERHAMSRSERGV